MDKKIIDVECPTCKGHRKCEVFGEIKKDWSAAQGRVDGTNLLRLLQCCGCETAFLHITSTSSEDWDFIDDNGKEGIVFNETIQTYPKREEDSFPEWAWELFKKDEVLYRIVKEIYLAETKGMWVLATIGLRTAIDRVTEIIGIDPEIKLPTRINKLNEDGFLGETESNLLKTVIEAGNGAAHRAWNPEENDFYTLLKITEDFIKRIIFGKRNLDDIDAKIPKRKLPEKKKK